MVMQTADEPLKDLIRQQFPRPRTLGSLAQNDLRFQIFDPKNPTVPRAKPVPPSTFVQFCWQLCAALQFGCVDESVCSKRGCGKRGTARCGSCKTALYCGPECQKSWVLFSPPTSFSPVWGGLSFRLMFLIRLRFFFRVWGMH